MLKKTSQVGLILFVLLVATSLLVFTGCGRGVNLKGADITIASWWQNYDTNTYEARSESEEKELDWRRKAESEHGFKLVVEQIADYDNYFTVMINHIMSGNKKFGIYQTGADMAVTLYKQGLLYPVSDSKAVDFKNRTIEPFVRNAYNGLVDEFMTYGGKTYGWTYGLPNNTWGQAFLYFNPRFLTEAGLSADHLYDLQKDNNWTWDTFLDVCRRLTRDTNNDGITDIYALPIDDAREFISGLVFGNGGDFVTLDAQGKAHSAVNSPNVIEAINFFNQLITEGLVWTTPWYDWGQNWTAFVDQRVAMTFDPEWRKGQMNDGFDAGYVLPPRGPRSTKLRLGAMDGAWIIPAFFSPDEVDVILKASEIWNAPPDADWLQGHYWASRNLRDVTESVAMSRDVQYLTPRYEQVISGYPYGDFIAEIRGEGLGNVNASQAIEAWMPSFMSAIDDYNR